MYNGEWDGSSSSSPGKAACLAISGFRFAADGEYIFFRYLHLFTMQVSVTDWFAQRLQVWILFV